MPSQILLVREHSKKSDIYFQGNFYNNNNNKNTHTHTQAITQVPPLGHSISRGQLIDYN